MGYPPARVRRTRALNTVVVGEGGDDGYPLGVESHQIIPLTAGFF